MLDPTRHSREGLDRHTQDLVDASGLTGKVDAFGHARRVVGRGGVQVRGGGQIAVAFVEVGGDCVATRDVGGNFGQRGKPSRRAVGLSHGDGSVEAHDRRVGESEQLVVPADDLRPVGLVDLWRSDPITAAH